VQVSDSEGGRDTLDVNLTIINVNDPPSFPTIADLTIFEDGHFGYNIRVRDPDLDVNPNEELTWTVEPPLFEIAPEGTITFVPTREDLGEYDITITVTDRSGEGYQQTFKLLVKHVNHPPIIEAIPDLVIIEDIPWSLDIRVSDVDPGDSVELTSRGAPFSVPSGGGLINWTPLQRHGGEHLVTLEATDLSGGKMILAFNLTIVTVNDPPQVTIQAPSPGDFFPYGEELYLTSLAEDEEGDNLVIVWSWRFDDAQNQQWNRINTGSTAFWPKAPDGPIRVRVEADDGSNVTTAEVVFTVGPPPDQEDEEIGLGPVILLIAIVAISILLILTRGMWMTSKKKPVKKPVEEEEEWEMV
jgi:hypothetical protein